MKIQKKISKLLSSNRVLHHLEAHRILEEKQACFQSVPTPFPPLLEQWIESNHIRLYSHQAQAVQAMRSGSHVILTTPTASGKTLSYNLPVIEGMLLNPQARALYIFPTKALTNDQWKTLQKIDAELDQSLHPAVYDGDTLRQKRSRIRKHSRIILTNPYMLHMILPWHHLWGHFFSSLEYVVLDEAHYYRGVFGSNMAMLIRRLKRICSFYDSNPLFFLSTATIENPGSFSEQLIGDECVHIHENGAPTGKKHFLLYNPYKQEEDGSTSNIETEWLLEELVKSNIQTLCFSLSRRNTEWITRQVQKHFQSRFPLRKSPMVSSYRGGYLPEERRIIENQLKKGTLKGIVSTNALEAGIDIGSLDAVLMNGYPGTMISTWQQAGRSGRGIDESLAILVARQNPLDQYFMKHPTRFFDRKPEYAIIDNHNPYILWGHLLCAAKEIPITLDDTLYFGDSLQEELNVLTQEEFLRKSHDKWLYNLSQEPFKKVSINNIGSEIFLLYAEGKLLETLDKEQAFREAYEGAIYLHQGETYLINSLNLEQHTIHATPAHTPFSTEALIHTDVTILQKWNQRKFSTFQLSFGKVLVTEDYYSYQVKKGSTVIKEVPLDLPKNRFDTTSLWIDLDPGVQQELLHAIDTRKLQGGIHGAEHAIIAIMPLYVLCDRRDLGGMSTLYEPETGYARIFIYDGFQGGIGLSEKGYSLIHTLLQSALELVEGCSCDAEDGCPACIQSPKCGNDNQILHKASTILFLRKLLEKES
jgi:DEAD/DEAH box helicase domain-containing protein